MNTIKPLSFLGLLILSQQGFSQYDTSWDNSEATINQISEHVYRWGGGGMGGINGLFVPTSEGIIVIDGPGQPCTPGSPVVKDKLAGGNVAPSTVVFATFWSIFWCVRVETGRGI